MSEVHASGPQEHALCGLSFDAFESGDHKEPVVFAQSGQLVTCVLCRVHIDHVRSFFRRGYRAATPKDTQ